MRDNVEVATQTASVEQTHNTAPHHRHTEDVSLADSLQSTDLHNVWDLLDTRQSWESEHQSQYPDQTAWAKARKAAGRDVYRGARGGAAGAGGVGHAGGARVRQNNDQGLNGQTHFAGKPKPPPRESAAKVVGLTLDDHLHHSRRT